MSVAAVKRERGTMVLTATAARMIANATAGTMTGAVTTAAVANRTHGIGVDQPRKTVAISFPLFLFSSGRQTFSVFIL